MFVTKLKHTYSTTLFQIMWQLKVDYFENELKPAMYEDCEKK